MNTNKRKVKASPQRLRKPTESVLGLSHLI